MTQGLPRGGHDIAGAASSAFPKMGFEEVEFPYTDLSIKGGIRYAQHEFPHSPGAEIEKLGRKPYVITCTGLFHYVKGSELDKQYPELYPTRLRWLREMFEKEITGALVVPTIGTIRAVATSWTQNFTTRTSSGESVQLEFVEDQDASTAFDEQSLDYGISVVLEKNDALLAAVALADFKSQLAKGIFQQINDAVTSVQAIFGTADAFSRLVEGKIRAIEQLCSFADSQVQEMQSPEHHLVGDALKDLWASSVALAKTVVQANADLLTYRVPKQMTVQQITASIYGDTLRTVEILQLNSFADALAVPAGTLVVYAP